MGILSIISNLFGIGKEIITNKNKLKAAKQEQQFKIVEAQTKASVDRILSNTDSDNQIDLITNQQKSETFKDDVVTYLFLIPVIIATATPFIIAYKTGDLAMLSNDIKNSYENLDKLPNWYKYVLGAIVIDVLGFRSFGRKIADKFLNNK
jgi:hypothetical protein|tara:strand:+ start:1020 stop:1469 length:450 start_codon:yes stop_codon:yes gene_type:complete